MVQEVVKIRWTFDHLIASMVYLYVRYFFFADGTHMCNLLFSLICTMHWAAAIICMNASAR